MKYTYHRIWYKEINFTRKIFLSHFRNINSKIRALRGILIKELLLEPINVKISFASYEQLIVEAVYFII